MVRARATPWGKMLFGGALIVIGGPALTFWLTPTEEELFLKYNPELQKRSLERRAEKQEDFNDFVRRLKEASKDADRPSMHTCFQEVWGKCWRDMAGRMRMDVNG
jgi:hypothetical protein